MTATFCPESILKAMAPVTGWLDPDEASLLMSAAARALTTPTLPPVVVEIGSFCGRSTTVLGKTAGSLNPDAKVYAIDPLEGVIGTTDGPLQYCVSTVAEYHENIAKADLTSIVQTIQKKSHDVAWDLPIALLLVDAFHDYASCRRDFEHFAPWLEPGGYVAFHDYCASAPGVVRYVDELIAAGGYRVCGRAYSLILLRKDDADASAKCEADIARAVLLREQGKDFEAVTTLRRVLEVEPGNAKALFHMALTVQLLGHTDAARGLYNATTRAHPGCASAWNNLGNVLHAQGDHYGAWLSYDQAMQAKPDDAAAHSNWLMCEQYRPGVTASGLKTLHEEWDQLHAAKFRPEWLPFDLTPTAGRPLRIGFVSPDLRRHPVGFLIVRMLEHLDPAEIATVVYATRPGSDDLTDRIRAATAEWHDVAFLSDADLAAGIRTDKIDILFDLSGHTCEHRLLTFARKPAPVQITWLGYVGTTGLAAMDYLLADRFHVPEGSESHYTEAVLRMPNGYACFDPPAEAPEVGPLPALTNGYITFGCFNNAAKVNREVVAAWAEILDRVPGSRLVLASPGYNSRSARERIAGLWKDAGGDGNRLLIRRGLTRPELLALYGSSIDIALDTFPYSGGVTTLEALWMGVPVVTCGGDTFAGRHSESHTLASYQHEGVSWDKAAYCENAAGFPDDLAWLSSMRTTIRPKMAASPVCDGPRFARDFTALMRSIASLPGEPRR